MTARFDRAWAKASRANLAASVGFLLSRGCTPDVDRLCPGEIPNVRAVTNRLRRQNASLSEACRVVFEP